MYLTNFSKNRYYDDNQKQNQKELHLKSFNSNNIYLDNIVSNNNENYEVFFPTSQEKPKCKIYNLNDLSNRTKNKKNYNISAKKISIDNYADKNQNIKRIYINNLSPKKILNKSNSTYSLNKKIDYDFFYNNDDNSILKQKILKKLYVLKKQRNLKINMNKLQNIYQDNYKNNLSSRTLFHNNAKNHVVIKFKKDININNIYNNSNIYNNNNILNTNSIKNLENKTFTKKTVKPYICTDIIKKPELFRNFEDLEKKSLEVSKRKKIKKNFSSNFFAVIKKDNNLKEIKLSLDAIRSGKKRVNNKFKKSKGKNMVNYDYNKIQRKSLKNVYNTTKNENELSNNKQHYINKNQNKNNSIQNKRKLFIVSNNDNKNSFNNKKKMSQSPEVNKKYIEDYIIDKVFTLSFTKTSRGQKFFSKNKKNIFNEKSLPSILEEDDKIKSNIINLINVLEKIINNKNIQIMRNSLIIIKSQNKINKNIEHNKNEQKHISNFKYTKKIIPKKIIKNKILNNNNNCNLIRESEDCKNKFVIFDKLEKSISLIDKLRLKLIEYSLKNKDST